MRLDPISCGVALGYVGDRVFGDPARHHPVAWFGTWAGWCDDALWRDSQAAGVLYVAVVAGPPTALAAALSRGGSATRLAVTALCTWAALGGRSLEREAAAVERLLLDDDLPGARRRIRSLVGRDTNAATAVDLARATVESLAENQSDAVAATLFWGAVAGAPGIVAHRCVNTLDAMVGHRTPRLQDFGWAAARLDDILNHPPARLSVLATAVGTGSITGVRRVFETVRRDAGRHPSPNAGPVEAAAAAALGVRLGGHNVYAGVDEDRGTLGEGRSVEVRDIAPAIAMTRRTARLVLVGCLGGRLLMTSRLRCR